MRLVLQLLLEEEYTVRGADDGRTAIAIGRSEHLDLVLLDILLPDIDGIEVLQELKTAVPQLPVIMLTGVTALPTAVSAMKLGAADYLTKPFQDEDLRTAIRSALRRRTLPTPAGTAHAHARRLLLVDGDPGRRAALALVLTRFGRVETVTTLTEAQRAVRERAPACIIVGVGGPELEVVRFLHTLEAELPACPALVIGDDARLRTLPEWSNLRQPWISAGPFDPGEVVRRVAVLVGCDGARETPRLSRVVNRAIAHLRLNYGKNITVGDVADAIGVSESRLAHLFRVETGFTVRDYLTRMRIEIAKDLLRRTDDKCSQIAAHVGFFDAPHLSRVFRKTTGQSPSAYRA